ncbi:hypothetical protein JHK85_006657 [Glycine max]|nr:hypothetical protein JHK85_006657 [Glycine max]
MNLQKGTTMDVCSHFVERFQKLVCEQRILKTYLKKNVVDMDSSISPTGVGQESIGHDPRFEGLLCFRSGKIPEGPILTFHFEGASVQLMSTQTFFMIEEGLFCFGMDGVSAEPYAFGNFVQSNILIGFDLDRKTISFMPTDRTKRVKGANGFCDVLKFVRRLLHRVRVLSQWLTTPLANHIIGAHHQ